MWTIAVSKRVAKQWAALPGPVQKRLQLLLVEIELYGPVCGNWPNYSALPDNRHHCHLKKGHPTYVAVWQVVDKKISLVQVSMSVLTKKRPTEKTLIRARITLPLEKWAETRKLLRGLKVKVEEETEEELIPWREAFPKLKDGDMPGLRLQAGRHHFALTQAALAEKTGIPQRHLSEMENGKRPIGKKTARVLAQVLKLDYRVFL